MGRKSLGVGVGFFAVVMMFIFAGSTPQAFHSGGVAECSGCHSMHGAKANGSFLLVGSDQSSTCLTCHMKAGDTGPSSYHIATADADMPTGTAPKQRTPGGDFGWLRKSYDYIGHPNGTEYGRSHGHNIVAMDVTGYVADTDNTTAPGGTFSSSQLGCTSCHDPHSSIRRLTDGSYVKPVAGQAAAPIIGSGSYGDATTLAAGQAAGAYRLLRGLGDNSQGVTYNGVAIAVAPKTYNQTEATNQVRVAYGSSAGNNWGTWCASCHTDMHSSGNYVHPTDVALGSAVANNYNSYVKSGDLSGTSATSFTSLVPFVENTGDIATLKSHASNSNAYLNGPASTDKVTCLSCHRAHASGFTEGLRFNVEGEFMVYQGLYPGTDNAGASYARGKLAAETMAAYYDRPVTQFASYQRVLCNKCHAKD